MKKLQNLCWVVIVAVFCFSCHDEAVKFDPRIQAEGEYNYWLTMYAYVPASGTLTPLGSAFDINGVFRISKDKDNESAIIVSEDGQVKFRLDNIVEIFNGFSFQVPNQSFKNAGQSYAITGFEGASVGSTTGVTLYQGYYSTNANGLEFWFQYMQNGTVIVCKVYNIKK